MRPFGGPYLEPLGVVAGPPAGGAAQSRGAHADGGHVRVAQRAWRAVGRKRTTHVHMCVYIYIINKYIDTYRL